MDDQYIYKNKLYIILHEGKMKVDDEWVPCVVYEALENNRIYVRTKDEFFEKFKRQST